jgi:hypothetical protein
MGKIILEQRAPINLRDQNWSGILYLEAMEPDHLGHARLELSVGDHFETKPIILNIEHAIGLMTALQTYFTAVSWRKRDALR